MAFQVKNTRRVSPIKMMIYGRPGIGKSTFAASAPNPIFVSLEDGLRQIDAIAVEPAPCTWTEALDAIDYAASLKHETIVIDSLSKLEPLCWAHVCEKGGKRVLGKKGEVEQFGGAKVEHIEAFGYGKGYNAAVDEWRVFLHRLETAWRRGVHIVLIAHATRKNFKNPLGDDYEQWFPDMNEKAVGALIRDFDTVGYCDEDIAIDDTSGRAKAQTTGRRLLRCMPHPAYLAKTRFDLPAKLPLSWPAFAEAVTKSRQQALKEVGS